MAESSLLIRPSEDNELTEPVSLAVHASLPVSHVALSEGGDSVALCARDGDRWVAIGVSDVDAVRQLLRRAHHYLKLRPAFSLESLQRALQCPGLVALRVPLLEARYIAEPSDTHEGFQNGGVSALANDADGRMFCLTACDPAVIALVAHTAVVWLNDHALAEDPGSTQ